MYEENDKRQSRMYVTDQSIRESVRNPFHSLHVVVDINMHTMMFSIT